MGWPCRACRMWKHAAGCQQGFPITWNKSFKWQDAKEGPAKWACIAAPLTKQLSPKGSFMWSYNCHLTSGSINRLLAGDFRPVLDLFHGADCRFFQLTFWWLTHFLKHITNSTPSDSLKYIPAKNQPGDCPYSREVQHAGRRPLQRVSNCN